MSIEWQSLFIGVGIAKLRYIFYDIMGRNYRGRIVHMCANMRMLEDVQKSGKNERSKEWDE